MDPGDEPLAILSAAAAPQRPSPVRLLHEHWTEVNGRRVFSRVAEAAVASGAPPIVHVHGFGISGRYMMPTASRLAVHYPVYVPDLPGHGRSDTPGTVLDIPGLADALAGYLNAMEISRAVVLANSLGCLVTAELAHRHPAMIARAILVSPAGGPHNRPLPRGATQLMRDALREPRSLARIAIPDYVRYGAINSLRMFHQMAHYPTVERLSALPVPFLGIVGMRDPLVSERQMTSIFHSPAQMDLVYHFDSAHAINFSHPEALARVVHAYLQGHPLDEIAEGERLIAHMQPNLDDEAG
ncbi:MAG: alpha/beta fold hydrolase [Thermomicrobiales bacterium]